MFLIKTNLVAKLRYFVPAKKFSATQRFDALKNIRCVNNKHPNVLSCIDEYNSCFFYTKRNCAFKYCNTVAPRIHIKYDSRINVCSLVTTILRRSYTTTLFVVYRKRRIVINLHPQALLQCSYRVINFSQNYNLG